MSILPNSSFSLKGISFFLTALLLCHGSNSLLIAEVQDISSPETRTVVAEVLEVEGDFHIVRGDRGEIRIEVTPDTQISEEFTFGDRIKAVLLPNDVAQIITRAEPGEPIGTISNELAEPPPVPTTAKTTETSEEDAETIPALYKAYQVPDVRVIVANVLMVDGSFYIIRSEHGEIQIEITPETKLSEDFKFGDKIKAHVTPADKAISVVRAEKDDVIGIYEEVPSQETTPLAISPPNSKTPSPLEEGSEPLDLQTPTNRIIVADVLMVDGDLYIVRGEKGEIRIEVTPKTILSESFDYGDRIKAEVLPNDKAISIERANPDDPIGISTP